MDTMITDRKSYCGRSFFLRPVILWFLEKLGVFIFPGWCNICRKPTLFLVNDRNLRENVLCLWCRSSNRKRQMMSVFDRTCAGKKDMMIWSTESRGSFHEAFRRRYGSHYIPSEFFGGGVDPGSFVKGVRNENMCHTSFDSNTFDVVFSSDDLEHIPEPREALHEVSRVLKPGGKFIFTVPFHIDSEHNDVRAKKNAEGDIEYFKEPEYHGDPLNPSEGILVYTVFGWELIRMCDNAGMQCRADMLHMPFHGILGGNAIVFVGQKKEKG